MKSSIVRISAALAVSGGLLVAASVLTRSTSHAQAPREPAAVGASYSAIHCIGCHGGPDTPAYKAYAQEKNPPTDFVRAAAAFSFFLFVLPWFTVQCLWCYL